MTEKVISLPEYPVTSDLWDEIRNINKPVIVYGMGNGADKLCERLMSLGVSVADFFASDGFVRGHSFRGVRVKSFSEICELYSDFLILLSFGTTKDEVISQISELDESYDLRIPDMPISDVQAYFDKDFYNANYENILSAYRSLSDERSRNVFASVINFKLYGKMSDLLSFSSDRLDKYELIRGREIKNIIDLGAYNGDTVKEFLSVYGKDSRIIAVEPDAKTYKRLLKAIDGIDGASVTAVNAAVFSYCGEGDVLSSGNRNSTISATASYEHSVGRVPFITVDSLDFAPDYIKMDVEGAEYEALLGARSTIERHRPVLLVSAYHKSRDIFFLVNYIWVKYPFYRIFLRRTRSIPAWEIELVLIPFDE